MNCMRAFDPLINTNGNLYHTVKSLCLLRFFCSFEGMGFPTHHDNNIGVFIINCMRAFDPLVNTNGNSYPTDKLLCQLRFFYSFDGDGISSSP